MIVALAAFLLASLPFSHPMKAVADSEQQCQLNQPKAVEVDRTGNIYVADTGNGRVLRCNARDGQCESLVPGRLARPSGLALHPNGRLYIADTENNRILLREPNGRITVIQSSILQGPTALELDSGGNLYIADTGNDRIVILTPRLDVCPVNTEPYVLDRPMGVAVGPLGMFIADTGNNRILFRPPGCERSLITIVPLEVINGLRLNQPSGMVLEAADLYIADTCNNRIVHVDLVATFGVAAGSGPPGCFFGGFSGDGGPATRAQLNAPGDVDLQLGLFIADTLNNRIRLVDGTGTITTALCR